MSNTNFNKIAKIIAKHTRVKEKFITIESTAETIERWDSLTHVKIIVDLEKDFDLQINTSIIGELNSVKSIIQYVELAEKNLSGL
ncbi:acyl carrier protein [Candidatus Pelagibacter bacterium]|nr:acyl carrier protein [Candidatus Pelagibacter bacterium]